MITLRHRVVNIRGIGLENVVNKNTYYIRKRLSAGIAPSLKN